MGHKNLNMKKIVLLLCVVFLSGCHDELSKKEPEMVSPRYELYKTENIFTSLLLDTRTGRLWQTQFSLDAKHFEGAIPISGELTSEDSGRNGRFSLSSTGNIFTFMLVDKLTGAMQHCQFSLDDKKGERGCYEIVSPR